MRDPATGGVAQHAVPRRAASIGTGPIDLLIPLVVIVVLVAVGFVAFRRR